MELNSLVLILWPSKWLFKNKILYLQY